MIEGITEFLPISSTGHLTIVEKLLGMRIDDPSVVAFTAIIQIGAILAAVIYFWSDIWRILQAWWRGLWWKRARRKFDYKYGWAIIIGSLPILSSSAQFLLRLSVCCSSTKLKQFFAVCGLWRSG